MHMTKDRSLDRRLTFVVAAAGYGKTSAVRRWLRDRAVCWCGGADSAVLATVCPDGLAELAAAGMPAEGAIWLVLDDVPRLSDRQLQALVCAVQRLPSRLRVVVVTRHPPASSRWRPGLLAPYGPADLALSPGQVASLLGGQGGADPALAARIHDSTAGWPALVTLAVATTRSGGTEQDDLAAADTPIESYVVREVLAELPPKARRLLRDAAHLEPIHAELCELIGHRRGGRLVAHLTGAGILAPAAGGHGYRMVPVVADVARRRLPLSASERKHLHAKAAAWYAEHGFRLPALRAYCRAGHSEATARLLTDHGTELLAGGGAEAIIAAFRALPDHARSAGARLVYGEALQIRGDFDAAIEVYAALAGRDESLVSGLAWRYGLVHYLRGEPRCALHIFQRGRLDPHPSTDNARLLSWMAATYWMTGDAAACRDNAHRALAAATATGGDDALAAAHAALALDAKLRGDRPATDEHHEKALRAADAARDTVQVTRIRANRASALVAEGRYGEALAELRPAVELAHATGYAAMLALALCNEGAAHFRLGQLAEATACYEQALPLLQRMGSRKVAYALVGLADIWALRGRASLARAAYEEAVRASEPVDDLQAQVPALAGLARVLAADDGATAIALAQRAVELERGPDSAAARIALGWVALQTGDRRRAAEVVVTASAAARRHRDRAALAEALELGAAAGDGPDEARRALREAAAILDDIGSPVAADRLAVLLGRLPGADPDERLAGRLAAERLAALGVPPPAAGPAHPQTVALVRVRTLGRFAVSVNGREVAAAGWQSRKARDLLRILAARRGRAVAREQLGELLWPDQDPGRVSHRLSVALCTLRAVLDPDRREPADHYVIAAPGSLALDVAHLELDVEEFLTEAAHGFRLAEQGEIDGARATLAYAERRYQGDFLEDEPYDDWSPPTRDEARRVYLRVVRTLAALARAAGDIDETVRYLDRALGLELYDEGVHGDLIRTLAAAGRHGEAAHAYERYARAMAAIGVPPRPRENLSGAEVSLGR